MTAWKATASIGGCDEPVATYISKAAIRTQVPRAVMTGGVFQRRNHHRAESHRDHRNNNRALFMRIVSNALGCEGRG